MSEEIEAKDTRTTEVHKIDIDASNPGNPVFTCDRSLISTAPNSVSNPKNIEPLCIPQHPMYSTSSGAYGNMKPTKELTPNTYHGRSIKFSEHLGLSGMYRNRSFNTSPDHSRV